MDAAGYRKSCKGIKELQNRIKVMLREDKGILYGTIKVKLNGAEEWYSIIIIRGDKAGVHHTKGNI